jgi:site-specific DNA-cytosine methylase
MTVRACFLLLLLPCLASLRLSTGPQRQHVGVCHAAQEDRAYLSQDYIDTVIQRAYINFNTAMDIAGTGLNQEQAIRKAKAVVRRLKLLATGDANQNYILWKVSELEYQIFLEEREIVRKAHQQKVSRLNDLVVSFNVETGRKRPNFSRLQDMQTQFAEVDKAKGREISYLINQRSITVSRNCLSAMNLAIKQSDMSRARKELDYCTAHEGALKLTPQQLDQIRAKLQSHLDAGDMKRFVEEDMYSTTRLLAKNNLRVAWQRIEAIDRRLEVLVKFVSGAEFKAYRAKRMHLENRLAYKEDSLVDAAIGVYNTRGRAVTIDFVDQVLRGHGVSEEKIAVVDQSMIGAAMAEMEADDRNPELRKLFVDLSDETEPDDTNILGDLSALARAKAQEAKDSIRAEEQRLAAIRQKEWEKKNRKQIKKDRKRKEKEAKRIAKQKAADDKEMARLESIQAEMRKAEMTLVENKPASQTQARQPEHSMDANQQLAQRNIVLIYGMIERNEVEMAYRHFLSLQEPLRQYLFPDAYTVLESTVMSAYRDIGPVE